MEAEDRLQDALANEAGTKSWWQLFKHKGLLPQKPAEPNFPAEDH
jgi:hypothetical protein